MRRLHLALLALAATLFFAPACAGPAVREQSAQVEHLEGQLEQTLAELGAVQAQLDLALTIPPGEGDEEQIAVLEIKHAALVETVSALRESIENALAGLPGAWQEDFDAAVSRAGNAGEAVLGGLLSAGGAQGGAIGIVSSILSSYLLARQRDKRKREGRDPLQRMDVSTPPTNQGPA